DLDLSGTVGAMLRSTGGTSAPIFGFGIVDTATDVKVTLNDTNAFMVKGSVTEADLGFDNFRFGIDDNAPRMIFEDFGGTTWQLDSNGNNFRFFQAGSVKMQLASDGDLSLENNNLDNVGVIFLKQQASADADVPAYGQIWTKTATPNQLWFTPDGGVDTQLDHTGAFPTTWSDTGITGAELETLSDTSDADSLHSHSNHGASHGNTLDEAYDEGGAGAGRTITVDDGSPIELIAAGPTTKVIDILQSGGGFPELQLRPDGILFGPGGGTPQDISLTRSGNNVLALGASDKLTLDKIGATTGDVLAVQSTLKLAKPLVLDKGTSANIDGNDEISIPVVTWLYLTSAGATDNLDGIGAGTEGQVVFLTVVAGKDITLVHNGTVTAGKKLMINGEATVTLDQDHDFAIAIYDATATVWNVLVPGSGGGVGNHNILDGSVHQDSVADGVTAGSVIIGNDTPKWDELVISIPGANILNVLGIANGETVPSWKSVLDGTNPAATAATASPGTSLISAHRDHVHPIGVGTTRGDILIWNSTPVASRLVAKTAGAYVGGDGTDVVSTIPKRTIVLTAAGGKEATTAGCAAAAVVEAGTNDVDYWVLDFDKDTDEFAFWNIVMPGNYDGGTITFRVYWTAASGSGTVVWNLKGRSYADSAAIDQAYTDVGETSTDTLITAGDVHISPESAVVTLNGSPAGGEYVQIKVNRDISEDTLTADARLLAIEIEYTTDAISDAI
ncbi:hypothetical protein LCGC14_2001160, partial [marine sediment metagenome]